MRFMHLSDLHLGIRVNGFSMLEDQAYILEQIADIITQEAVETVILAGDIYDKSIPPVEAVLLLDHFLNRLVERKCTVLAISGNHDSPERLTYGQKLLARGGVHLAALYDGEVPCVRLSDEFGFIDCYLLPFIKPSHVRSALGLDGELDYTGAIRAALKTVSRDPKARSLLVTHQFVTGASRTDSERISIGGTDNVDAAVFSGFDYVALGHIHRAQKVGNQRLRYCGTPLKYSFSEAEDTKSVTIVDFGVPGEIAVREIPLMPLRDLRMLRGSFESVIAAAKDDPQAEDYLRIILTDEDEINEVLGKLRSVYPNIMRVEYEHRRSADQGELTALRTEAATPEMLFEAFYEAQNNRPMTALQQAHIHALIERIWEDRP